MHQCEVFGVVKRGIAHLVFIDPEIMVQKYPHIPRHPLQIFNADPPKKDIFVAGDGIVTDQPDAEPAVYQFDVGDKRLRQILECSLPVVGKHP